MSVVVTVYDAGGSVKNAPRLTPWSVETSRELPVDDRRLRMVSPGAKIGSRVPKWGMRYR